MSKGKLVESFNQYLTNPEEHSRSFSKALKTSSGEERIEALHQLLTYKDDGSIDHTSISEEVGPAIRQILKKAPNILEYKEQRVPKFPRRPHSDPLYGKKVETYAFADEIANCKHSSAKAHIAEHIIKNTKDSGKPILSGDDSLSATLNAQLRADPKAAVHFITSCNHYKDPRGQRLLDEIVNKIPSIINRDAETRAKFGLPVVIRKDEIHRQDLAEEKAIQNIVISALNEGMEISKEQFKVLKLAPDQLNKMLEDHIASFDKPSRSWDRKPESKLSDNIFKQALDSLKEKEGPDSKLSAALLKKTIDQNNPKLVCDMAMRGFKLEASYNKFSRGTANDLAKELLDNKNSLTKTFGNQKLTDNDQQRIALLASSSMEKKEQTEFLKKNKGISPLKLAIDTKQFDIAAKMIADGASLKPSELSLGVRMKNAMGMTNIKLETVKAIESNKAMPGGFVEKLKQQRSGTQQKTH
jgi:hypothetical protein